MPHDTIPEWMLRLFAHVDTKNTDGFVGQFAPDAYFRFANNPPAEGQQAIFALVEGIFANLEGIEHDFRHAYAAGDTEILEGAVTYHRKDGRKVGPLPFCSVFEMKDDKIQGYRVYVDASPLFAP